MAPVDTRPLSGREELPTDREDRTAGRNGPRRVRGRPAGRSGAPSGRPRPAREQRRRLTALALPAVAVALVVTGLLLPQALLLAAGLATAGVAAHLFMPGPTGRDGGPDPPAQ
ncbi:hypothetical protein AB0K49_37240 [Streptomyces decoyicus]|uniref:hypothetical protein n=1 Tax=Streptomyces decoyicus TaxID=249567 RepID=UPI00345C9EBE